MEKMAPNSKYVWHSTKIIRQSKIRGPLQILNISVNSPWNINNRFEFYHYLAAVNNIKTNSIPRRYYTVNIAKLSKN